MRRYVVIYFIALKLPEQISRGQYRACLDPLNIDKLIFAVNSRSSCSEVFCKKGVLTNFAKFTGKRLCQILFLNEVAGLKHRRRCFSVNFVKFQRKPFLQNTSGGCFC